MSFSVQEVSAEGAQPVELYEFNIGGQRFRYTNAEQDVVHLAQTYESTQIARGRIISTVDNKNAQLNVKVPGDNEFARLYVGIIPGELPQLTIRQLHTTDLAAESIFVFQGFVSTVGFTNNLDDADLACRPATAASGRAIPRHTFQGLCNHTLYDERCKQLEADYEETVTVDSVDGNDITIAASELSTEAADFWTAGFIQFGQEFRTISVQTTRVMTVDLPFLEDPTGATVRILPGCDYLIDGDCLNVFQSTESGEGSNGNTINHSGYPYVSQKNPFEGLD